MSKILFLKSTMFLNRNIHKYTWNTPDWKPHKQTDNILIHRRWDFIILDVPSFRRVTVILITSWWLQKLGKIGSK